jgi:hypothetical protein
VEMERWAEEDFFTGVHCIYSEPLPSMMRLCTAPTPAVARQVAHSPPTSDRSKSM